MSDNSTKTSPEKEISLTIKLEGRMAADVLVEKDIKRMNVRKGSSDPLDTILPGEDPINGWVLQRFAFNPDVKNCPVIDSIRIKTKKSKSMRTYKKQEFEIFPFIPGYGKQYAISQYGTVLELEEKQREPGHYNAWMRESARPTKSHKRPQVSLTYNGHTDHVLVYRLVADMFCENKSGVAKEDCEVHHIDKDATNNSYFNLFWTPDKNKEERDGIKSHSIMDRVRGWEVKVGDKWKRMSPEKIMYYFRCTYQEIIDATETALNTTRNEKWVIVSLPNHATYEGARDYKIRVVRAGKTPPAKKRKKRRSAKKSAKK